MNGEASSQAYSGFGVCVADKNVRNSCKAPADSTWGQKNWIRSSMFKKKSKSKRILKMIREYGEQYEVEQPG